MTLVIDTPALICGFLTLPMPKWVNLPIIHLIRNRVSYRQKGMSIKDAILESTELESFLRAIKPEDRLDLLARLAEIIPAAELQKSAAMTAVFQSKDINTDIPARKDVFEVESRETILDTLVANVEEGILITDANNAILSASERYCEMFGVDCHILKEKLAESEPLYFDKYDLSILQDAKGSVEIGTVILSFEFIVEAMDKSIDLEFPNGNIYRFKCKSLPNGQVLHSYFDLTKDKTRELELSQARVALHDYEVLTEEALEIMGQGILVCDADKIILANEKISKITNIPPEYFQVGRDWRDYLHYAFDRGDFGEGESAQNRLDAIMSNSSKGDGAAFERKSGEGSYVSVTANRREDGCGRVVTYTDITQNKEREFQLEQALSDSEAADRAKSEFLANMSHEIRTPMNGVLGMAELLARTSLDNKQKTFIDIIVKSGTSLLTIINDILDFSKIDAGQLKLDPAPFRINDAIEDVATLVSSRVAEKDLELAVRINPDLPAMFIGDVGRIRQIVTNLMGNAVKFTDKGHVIVSVGSKPGESDGEGIENLHFRIEDTGIGIPEHNLGRVFDKFSQVDESATRNHEGTGLGLAIASSLVELMGGKIGVESVQGEGSTFWFTIPMPVHEEKTVKRKVPVDVSGSRVLVVDDNEVNREILSEQMANWKFDSAACCSGAEAMAVMRAAVEAGVTIDAVILDYQMPGMDGGEVAKAMRAEKSLSHIPIVMLTSVDQMEDGSLFSSLAIQGHLTKPVRSFLLLETLIEVLQDNHSDDLLQSEGIRIAKALGGMGRFEEPTTPALVELKTAETPSAAAMKNNQIDVLIVENNDVNQIVFTQILEATGLNFKIAANGVEALELYDRHQPKLIYMDVSMPEMNGYEATIEIRKREQGGDRHTPIIGVTAHAVKGDREKCLDAGMDDYLSKPVSPDAFDAKIHKWLKDEKQSSEMKSA